METILTKINYWHMQMHPDNKSFADAHVYSVLEQRRIIGLGTWDEGEATIDTFRDLMQVNDVVAIKNGSRLIALVQVIGGCYRVTDDTTDIGWIENRRPVRILDWAIDIKNIPQPRGTLKRCVSDSAETTQIIKQWHSDVCKSFKKRGLPLYV